MTTRLRRVTPFIVRGSNSLIICARCDAVKVMDAKVNISDLTEGTVFSFWILDFGFWISDLEFRI